MHIEHCIVKIWYWHNVRFPMIAIEMFSILIVTVLIVTNQPISIRSYRLEC